jgi:hypothetical protein
MLSTPLTVSSGPLCRLPAYTVRNTFKLLPPGFPAGQVKMKQSYDFQWVTDQPPSIQKSRKSHDAYRMSLVLNDISGESLPAGSSRQDRNAGNDSACRL